MDHYIRSFDLEFTGIGNIRGYHGGFFTGYSLILVIKSFQFLVFYTAVLKETFHLRLSEHNRVWGIFLCFNDLHSHTILQNPLFLTDNVC